MTTMPEKQKSMEYDVVIVGAGLAGLSAAIRLKQLNNEVSVCILEKGSKVGAHLFASTVLDPKSLNELIPDWKEKGAPVKTPIIKNKLYFFTKNKAFKIPIMSHFKKYSNYIISIGDLACWLGNQAESLGVEIHSGVSATEILYDNDDYVIGVATGDIGLGKDGKPTTNYTQGIKVYAKQTIFAEGCRGSLTKQVINKFNLDKDSDPQTYALSIKEVWEILPENHKEGLVTHGLGWPLDSKTYGSSFIYHASKNQVYIGMLVGLDYKNPYLSPFKEMQKLKTHPKISKLLKDGKRIAYGAHTLAQGGFQSLPKLTFAGGMLIGDGAGFLNSTKIKANHMTMKSGMVAAESVIEYLKFDGVNEIHKYSKNIQKSWIWKDLYKVRNIRPGFNKGLWLGVVNAVFETITCGKVPWTLKNHTDYKATIKAINAKEINYPKPDGILTFDRISSVHLANISYREDQPIHLQLAKPEKAISVNFIQYNSPESRYCPAAVYEIIENENGVPALQINAANCIHCKCCDIKDPEQNITWVAPEGGSGPNYGFV